MDNLTLLSDAMNAFRMSDARQLVIDFDFAHGSHEQMTVTRYPQDAYALDAHGTAPDGTRYTSGVSTYRDGADAMLSLLLVMMDGIEMRNFTYRLVGVDASGAN